jgi:peptidoglycan hydrolase CwlO-like protein
MILTELLTVVLSVMAATLLGIIVKLSNAGGDLKDEKNSLVTQLRNQDQDLRNVQGDYGVAREEVKRLTNTLIEVQNRANLVTKDAADRMAEFKKHPTIACMTDGQVAILAEMLAIHLRDILSHSKEYIN